MLYYCIFAVYSSFIISQLNNPHLSNSYYISTNICKRLTFHSKWLTLGICFIACMDPDPIINRRELKVYLHLTDDVMKRIKYA